MSDKTPAPALPERKKSRTPLVIAIVAIVAALAVVAALVIPGLVNPATAESDDTELTTVSIGVTNASEDYWQLLSDLALDEGIKIELVNFTEYPLPNPALAAGETDLNSFQHLDYLSNHNIATGDNLQPIGSTVIVPLPLYSTKYDSVDDIPQGAEIAIPNDPSNQGRAINVLVSAGLLKLNGEPTIPTPADIDTANSVVTVTPVEASQTPAALQSVDGAVINNNFALDAGLDPTTALYAVDPNDPLSWPYLNVFAARPDDIDNPVYLKVVELWHTPEVEASVRASSKNTAVIIDLPADELRDRLASIEKQKRAAQ